MKDNIVKNKSFNFAIEIVGLYKALMVEEKEYVMSRQLLKSGTSIGANIREAEFAQSKPDFISKMSIALKEANEADYWIEILYQTDFIAEETFHNFKCKSKELIKLLVTIVKNAKN
ncbi:four helix bundle protein [Zhouia amylolytica]|uniref:Four helix bundle protein n=1 Tax=Zhouia amylolytica TaxID=376730 RepID=A0A1I6P3C9_9FLAO|nr:four helix bundle protein [Zhouia amylolytica]MCQ0111733.1 four helix bundle protein [Zhouia amylolytica]SFS34675.1 four helix bundle protein [Zhouia amylolytica]